MHIKIRNELIPLNLLVIILILIINFKSDSVFRIAIALQFMLFFPGYTLVAALFPRWSSLGNIERVALSFGMSISILPLIGLALNYTPWGISLTPVLYSVSLFIFITSFITWFRRRKLPEKDAFSISLQLKRPQLEGSLTNKILSIILLVSILFALQTLIYTIIKPKTGEQFTEFYILGAESGKAEGYPCEIVLGDSASVILGITNYEHELVTYTIDIIINGEKVGEAGVFILEHEETWEGVVTFSPLYAGANRKVEFLLYKDREIEPYRLLHLWVDVKE